MKNNTCIVCGKNFPPREGKMYCSDSCKQNAYIEKKESKKEPEQKIVRFSKAEVIYTIDFTEYEKIAKQYGLTIEQYSFLRKNLSGKYEIEQIRNYIDSFFTDGRNILEEMYKEGSTWKKQFNLFLEMFHCGYVEIIYPEKPAV